MATYTALQTLSSKASGTTLTSSSHILKPGEAMVVFVGSVDTAGSPASIKHNGRSLRRRVNNANATDALHVSGWIKGGYQDTQSGTVVITWSSAIVERAATIGKLDLEINKEDEAIKDDTSTTNPGTSHTGDLITAGSFVVGQSYEIDTPGTTDFTLIGAANSNAGTIFTATGVGSGTGTARENLSVTDAFAIAGFLARGPSNDTAGTVEFDLGGTDSVSWTAATGTQRDGTVGAPPVSNVTLNVGWLQLTDEESVRARINAYGTARTWANGLLVVRPRLTELIRQGITPSDWTAVEQIVADAGGDTDNVLYGINQDTGLWEAFEVAAPGAAVSTRDEAGAWS